MLQENIPLTRLVAAALRIKQAHEETSGTFAKVEHLPIFAMTKVNAIAIRYNTPNAEVILLYDGNCFITY